MGGIILSCKVSLCTTVSQLVGFSDVYSGLADLIGIALQHAALGVITSCIMLFDPRLLAQGKSVLY